MHPLDAVHFRPVRLAAALSIMVLAASGSALAEEEKPKERPKVGEDAPNFVLRTMNPDLSKSKRFVLRDFIGADKKVAKKSVVLSFAASYCEPCKKELAELATMKKTIDDAGVVLAVVVIDTDKAGIDKMKALTVDKLKLEYPVLSDRFGVLARRYKANELPMTVIIDPETSKIRWVSAGFAEGAMDRFKKAIGI